MKCKPPLPDDELTTMCDRAWGQPDRPGFESRSLDPSTLYRLTDTGNAERFRDGHKHHARYCPQLRSWMIFDGVRWVKDPGGLGPEIERIGLDWGLSADPLLPILELESGSAEDYRVELSGVTVRELTILPDKSGGDARASLAQGRLAG